MTGALFNGGTARRRRGTTVFTTAIPTSSNARAWRISSSTATCSLRITPIRRPRSRSSARKTEHGFHAGERSPAPARSPSFKPLGTAGEYEYVRRAAPTASPAPFRRVRLRPARGQERRTLLGHRLGRGLGRELWLRGRDGQPAGQRGDAAHGPLTTAAFSERTHEQGSSSPTSHGTTFAA